MAITRGFTGRRRQAERDPRLPPGQYDVGRSWPVLTAEPTPRVDAERWSLSIDGLVANPTSWSLRELRTLAGEASDTYRGDIHCVTTWSKLDTSFTGISLDTLLGIAQPLPEATYVVEESTTRYRTNLPLADVTGGKAWVVWEHEGKPLAREHGGPVRMIVPHLYFWKPAKWISKNPPARPRRARFLGTQRLSRSRRPVARAALRRGLSPEMAETGNDRRLAAVWRDARVVEVRHHHDLAVILRLDVPDRVVHRPGQHYVLWLRAEDGYTASRSYSAVSAPSEEFVELYVERVPDGEVSGFLAEVVEPGDELECRGPIGRWFAWDGRSRALGIGGGSGVAPLVSMLRHAHDVGRPELLSLAVSARTAADLPYRESSRRRARSSRCLDNPEGSGWTVPR